MKLIFVNWDTDKVVSWCALIVAACSMIVTYVELSDNRAHQRLSVKPIVEYYRNSSNEPGHEYTKFGLANTGLGPARVGNFELYIDNQLVRTYKEIQTRIMEEYSLKGKKMSFSYSTSDVWEGRVIKAEQETFFLGFKSGTFAQYATKYFNKHNLGITICYCSLYEECERFDPYKGKREKVRKCRWSEEKGFLGNNKKKDEK